MELFFPSVIVLLLAAAVVFFVFPRFGPATLAIISAVLLAFGLYQHYTTFGTEYRFSTWQLVSFAPYLMVGGLLLVIAIFLLYTLPVGTANTAPTVNVPTVEDMPPANTSTNMLTSGINKTLNTAAGMFNAGNKRNNNSIFNNLGDYMPNFGNNRNKGLNFPFSQV
jgi:hypothetical protein